MDKIKILALFGESGAGKNTIQRWLATNLDNMHEIISCTTRPKRDYEKEGKDYYFMDSHDFINKYVSNEILEFSIFKEWYYGTSLKELKTDKINVGVFNPQGVQQLCLQSNIDILPVWIKSNDKTRLLRVLNRESDPDCEEICRRFLADKDDFKYLNFDYEIYLNDKNTGDYYGFLNRPKISEFIKGQN